MPLYDYILKQYGPNEPILVSDLSYENYSQAWIYKQLNKLLSEEKIVRYEKGIYYIPTKTPFGKSLLNPRKVIERKYISQKGESVGYYSGVAFQNQLRLTTQMPNVIEIYTNNETTKSRGVYVGKQKVLLRKARTKITNKNVNVLSFLELMNDLTSNAINEEKKKIIEKFISDKGITRKDISDYAPVFPDKTMRTLIESGVIYSVTQ